MNEKLQIISDRACRTLADLILENETEILASQQQAEKEAERQGKKFKFRLSYKTTIGDLEVSHRLAWSVGQCRDTTNFLQDPNQLELPSGEPVDPEANPRKRRKKAAAAPPVLLNPVLG